MHLPPYGSGHPADMRRAELNLREREIEIKAKEVELKHNESKRDTKLTPILIAIWTTAVAAFGNGVVSWFNGQQMHKLENDKAQSAVILEVVKTNSPDKAANNLAFLVEIGVIAEQRGSERLRKFLTTRTAGQGPSTTTKDDAATDVTCIESGDYVVADVHWGDSDGGLNIRIGPNQTPIGVMPPTGTGIEVGTCSGGWCQVRYKCASGWAFAKHLALRNSRLARVKDGIDPKGLLVRRDPGLKGEPVGLLPVNTGDVVKHVCQTAPPLTSDEWCQISLGKIAGWVPSRDLDNAPASLRTPTSAPTSKSQ